MKFIIINTDYMVFVENQYQNDSDLVSKNFDAQYQARMSTFFGTNDFYSKNLKKLGHPAVDLIYNHRYLQDQWAK